MQRLCDWKDDLPATTQGGADRPTLGAIIVSDFYFSMLRNFFMLSLPE
jgi:hypothetical protein